MNLENIIMARTADEKVVDIDELWGLLNTYKTVVFKNEKGKDIKVESGAILRGLVDIIPEFIDRNFDKHYIVNQVIVDETVNAQEVLEKAKEEIKQMLFERIKDNIHQTSIIAETFNGYVIHTMLTTNKKEEI